LGGGYQTLDTPVSEKEAEQRLEFARWLNELKLQYINYEMGKGNPTPTDADFALRVLGQKPASLSRWVSLKYTPTEQTLLQIAVNTASRKPLEIFGKTDIFGDPALVDIVVNFRRLDPEHRQEWLRVARSLEGRGRTFHELKLTSAG
jgi:hypothetical protein